MGKFCSAARSATTRDSTTAPAVRYAYDRPLPYARHLRLEFLGPDGAVQSAMTKRYHPRRGWVTASVSDFA